MDYSLYKHGCRFSDESTYLGHEQSKGVFEPEDIEALFPINPLTGYPEGDISRLMDLGLTASEKEAIINRLQRSQGQYFPDGLSDDEILSLVPSRKLSDHVDLQAWRDYLTVYVLPEMSDTVVDKITDIVAHDSSDDSSDSNNDKEE